MFIKTHRLRNSFLFYCVLLSLVYTILVFERVNKTILFLQQENPFLLSLSVKSSLYIFRTPEVTAEVLQGLLQE